jgi:hypothetical protein
VAGHQHLLSTLDTVPYPLFSFYIFYIQNSYYARGYVSEELVGILNGWPKNI